MIIFKKILLLSLIIISTNCSSFKSGNGFYNGKYSIEKNPPGTVSIDNNLFVDINEVSNFDYYYFRNWIGIVYGKNSKQYQEILQDTTVWEDTPYETDELKESYHIHPLYYDNPVVGINLHQANLFTEWRNDRVAESILISQEIIEVDSFPTPENHFTIERYLNKQFHKTIRHADIIIPIYKIPSKKEWEYFARGNPNFIYGTDSLSRWNKKVNKRKGTLFCTKEYTELPKTNFTTYTAYKYDFSTNTNGLFGIIGNVSELVSEQGISKGGSWMDSIHEIKIETDNVFESANCYTGFRNICEWQILKIKKETQ